MSATENRRKMIPTVRYNQRLLQVYQWQYAMGHNTSAPGEADEEVKHRHA